MIIEEIGLIISAERELQAGLFRGNDSIDAYLSKLEKRAEFYLHYIEGRCVGFVAFYCNHQESQKAFITLVLVHPEVRGRKIATGLVAGVIALARERGFKFCELEVFKNNAIAIKLYRGLGFSICSTKESSYIMSRVID
ncbi:GNAT family N-acetyltransferase [Metapseudomonas boanensis]|uniref:GNAT family N-acetyltransferase n=1 Tax=Metapseudomonas boanensis TaxID=2822138 RepID=A0ABS5XDQ1_9GAMM|nr:GNAT family N-acetyltransferase [Pseudomonas boanensis]MBT8765795.1 GNAT family N-acetyltransferase [Pseudomonas boanensis]